MPWIPFPFLSRVGWRARFGSALVGALLLGHGLPLRAQNCVAPVADLVAWWSGEGDARDRQGSHHGTLGAGVTFAAGKVGRAFDLNGTSAGVEIPAHPELDVTGPITLEAWVFPRNPVRQSPIIEKYGTTTGGYGLRLQNSRVQFFTTDNCCAGDLISGGTPLKAAAWYHVAGVWDGESLRVYVNGVLDGTLASRRNPKSGATPVRIGARGDDAFEKFDGLIDEPALYRRALKAAELKAIADAGGAGRCPNSVPTQSAKVPYFTDFEAGIGAEWSKPTRDASERIFTAFSGRFGNDTQTLSLEGLRNGAHYTIGFDLYIIDTWDGNADPKTPDSISVSVDGVEIFRESFSNYNGDPPQKTQSFCLEPRSRRRNLGFGPTFADAIYPGMGLGFTASGSTAKISFRGWNLQNIDDESWGIDNVSVRESPRNDRPEGALTIGPEQVHVDLKNATGFGDPETCVGAAPGVWYRYVAANSGPVRISLQGGLDSGASVFQQGACLRALGCKAGTYSLKPGTPYLILVQGWGDSAELGIDECIPPKVLGIESKQSRSEEGLWVEYRAVVDGSGPFSFQWEIRDVDPRGGPLRTLAFEGDDRFSVLYRPNDEGTNTVRVTVVNGCGNAAGTSAGVSTCAVCLSRGTPSLLSGTAGSTVRAAIQAGSYLISRDARWFRMVTSTEGGQVTVTTEGTERGIDTVLAVFTGSFTAPVFVQSNDDALPGDTRSRVVFDAQPQARYWIAVDTRVGDPAKLRLLAAFPPRIGRIARTAGQGIELITSNAPATRIGLEMATNLAGSASAWKLLSITNAPPELPQLRLMDPSGQAGPRRFYRLLLLPPE